MCGERHRVMGSWCLSPAYPHWRGPWSLSSLGKGCEELQEMLNSLEGAVAGLPRGVVLLLLPRTPLWTGAGAAVPAPLSAGHHRPRRRCHVWLWQSPEPCLPHKEASAFAFCLLFFPPVSGAAGAPLLQLFCDTAQPSNAGSPDQRAAVTDSLVQAGQVPNLLFIPESSAE